MKFIYVVLCVLMFGCGAKSNEEIAHELIVEKLKTTLPDFKSYNSLNFGDMGTASLPYKESSQSLAYEKSITILKDSIATLEKSILQNNAAALQLLKDSAAALSEKNTLGKQSYAPETLYKISHAYTVKNEAGDDKKTEDNFYIDANFKKVVKVVKVY